MRRSGDRAATDALTVSNVPLATAMLYRKTALRMIQPIGNSP
jgi:hypothetical protein